MKKYFLLFLPTLTYAGGMGSPADAELLVIIFFFAAALGAWILISSLLRRITGKVREHMFKVPESRR